MSGIVQIGGVALASHDSGTDKVSLDSGTVFPAGHVIQFKTFNSSPATITNNTLPWTRVAAFDVAITRTAGTNLSYFLSGGGVGMDNNAQHFSATVMRSSDSFSSNFTNLGAGASDVSTSPGGAGLMFGETSGAAIWRHPLALSVTDTASISGSYKYGFFTHVEDGSFAVTIDNGASGVFGIILIEFRV